MIELNSREGHASTKEDRISVRFERNGGGLMQIQADSKFLGVAGMMRYNRPAQDTARL